jgi:phytoene dehydrogenase-like protein
MTVVIVGAGPNGLVAACILARAGVKPLVLEARDRVGGIAVTEEIHPGFRCPTLMHAVGSIPSSLHRELDLARHGLQILPPEVRLCALHPSRPPLLIHDSPEKTAASIEKVSAKDARAWPGFCESMTRIGALLSPVLRMTPPSIDSPSFGEVWQLLKVGKEFRALPKKDAFRLLRWGPMAVADLVSEWFDDEGLRAAIAARGIHGTFAGPWSAGTSVQVLLQAGLDGYAVAPSASARGGPGAFSDALAAAARAAGAKIRTGAPVSRILVENGAARGVILEDGEEIAARAVISNADPRRTLLHLVEPTELDPDFITKVRNYRSSGTAAKVNLALSALPAFRGVDGNRGALSGRIHIGPDIDYLERAFDAAKYGTYSTAPYLDVTIPSVLDPSLAPEGRHVMSVHVQFAPYQLREGDWEGHREALGDRVVRTLEEYAPGLGGQILDGQILTPADLERIYGLTGGHLLHGEPTIDQLFTMRPILGWAQYRTPIRGLYLCGSGTHPGGGVTGLPGANAGREILKDLR